MFLYRLVSTVVLCIIVGLTLGTAVGVGLWR